MPAEPVARFRELLAQTPADAGALDQLIADLTARGARRDAIRCARLLRRSQRDTAASIKAELTNQLCLGNETRVRSLLARYRQDARLSPAFTWMLERYLDRASLRDDALAVIDATRSALLAELQLHGDRSPYLQALEGFSDYVIISNSNRLQFSEEEKAQFRAMDRPLFIYQNIGNPLILPMRREIYNVEAREVVIGGFKNLFTSGGDLFFQPWQADRFLGALTRVNPKFLALWTSNLSGPIRKRNSPHPIHTVDENLLIDSFYPLTLFNTQGRNQRRLCTNGWISLCLFDAIARANTSPATLWCAGFSMSASYVFESCESLYFHDYPFEKVGLDMRLESDGLRSIGSTTAAAPEGSAAAHLRQAGISSEKLVDFKKRTGHWPQL